ncbi:hypothetical protein ACFVX6_02465 [Streptomyces sp. NPDC058289]|uniref:hypothetical protein n=1 Tax=Streptomyces sp. NPDC058289 TaxID=3346425 RepID=UPI0036E7994B
MLIRTDLGMAVVLLPLLAVRSGDQIRILFPVLIVYGCSSVLLDAAEAALVATAVPETLRGDFNGLWMTANEGMKLVAPLLGALLSASSAVGQWPCWTRSPSRSPPWPSPS